MVKREIMKQIHDRLRGKPYLLPVFHSVFNIPERLYEYDENLFLVFNTRTQRYEVHSLENKGNTFCVSVAFNELDERLLNMVRKGNIRVRGRAVFEEIDRHNEKLEASLEKKRQNDLEAVAGEMRSSFAKTAWEGI